jgi:hypothetical protein
MSMKHPYIIDAAMTLPFDLICASGKGKSVSIQIRSREQFDVFLINPGAEKAFPLNPPLALAPHDHLFSYTTGQHAMLLIRHGGLVYLLSYAEALQLSLLDEEEENT